MALIVRWCIIGRIMSLLDFWLPLTTSPGPDTLDLYLAEHPGRLVIPISRKNATGLRTRDLLVDAPQGPPGPVGLVLVVDDLVAAPVRRPAGHGWVKMCPPGISWPG
jgi:hypothetical protein